MSSYQIVNGYMTQDGTWVAPYLRGTPNGLEIDNINYDPTKSNKEFNSSDLNSYEFEMEVEPINLGIGQPEELLDIDLGL